MLLNKFTPSNTMAWWTVLYARISQTAAKRSGRSESQNLALTCTVLYVDSSLRETCISTAESGLASPSQ